MPIRVKSGSSAGALLGALAIAGSPAMAQVEAPAPAAVAPSAAQPDAGMAEYFKGTLDVTLPAFPTYHVSRQFFPDHTYADVEGRKVARGAWSVENGKICTQRPNSERYCNLGVGRTIGERWQDKDPYSGNEVDFALLGGRKPLP
jgi:hypothetical protein